ncbi:MAG: hypothetical protein JSR48_05650 [Verrucomicrobia bacterium]|nr:hypothetical protein [Verrucomicrobiota bacterium]
MRSPRLLAGLAGLMLPLGLWAQGGPPFMTNDPGTPEAGHIEANVAWTTEHRPGETVTELPHLDLNYGLTDRVQLTYEVGHVTLREEGGSAKHAWGNSAIAVKWRFYDQGEQGWSLATEPLFEFRTPGSRAIDLEIAPDETTFELPLEIQRPVGGGWIATVELGTVFHSKSSSSHLYGIALGRELGERLEFGFELHGEAAAGLGRTELAANVGVRVKVHPSCVLLAAVGRELHNHFEERASLLAYVAVQYLR